MSQWTYPKTVGLCMTRASITLTYECDEHGRCDFTGAIRAIEENMDLCAEGTQKDLLHIVRNIDRYQGELLACRLDGFQISRGDCVLLRLCRNGGNELSGRTGLMEYRPGVIMESGLESGHYELCRNVMIFVVAVALIWW